MIGDNDGADTIEVLAGGRQSAQMSPAEARQHALHILEAAEASEHDALVWAELGDMGLDEQTRGQFLVALRNRRGH